MGDTTCRCFQDADIPSPEAVARIWQDALAEVQQERRERERLALRRYLAKFSLARFLGKWKG